MHEVYTPFSASHILLQGLTQYNCNLHYTLNLVWTDLKTSQSTFFNTIWYLMGTQNSLFEFILIEKKNCLVIALSGGYSKLNSRQRILLCHNVQKLCPSLGKQIKREMALK